MPTAYMLSISSPMSHWDKMMSLERVHKGSKDVLTFRLPTWEFNPELPRNDPFIAKKYREDPIKAERDYAANPPMAASAWIEDISPILQAASGNGCGQVRYSYAYNRTKSGNRQRYAEIVATNPGRGEWGRILSLDAGLTNNSFALAVTEPLPNPMRRQETKPNEPGRVFGARVVALVEVAPVVGDCSINYSRLYKQLIGPMIGAFNVKLVLADRWQSQKIISDAADDYDVYADEYSIKVDDLVTIKDYLLDEDDARIILPKPELDHDAIIRQADMDRYPECFKNLPMSHLVYQFMVTNEDDKGMLAKGHGATDDLLRAVCLGLTFALNEEAVQNFGLLMRSTSIQGSGIVHMAGAAPRLSDKGVAVISTQSSHGVGRVVSAGARAGRY